MISLRKIAGLLTLLLMVAMFTIPRANAACTAGGCVMAGPRLLTLDTKQSALLSPLTSALLGSSVTATAADWEALAGADVKLLDFASALNAQTSAGSPTAALTANATMAQVLSAAATAASNGGQSTLATAITNLTGKIPVPSQQINLANMFTTTGNIGTSNISVLDLINGTIEAHNYQYGVTTTSPVTVGSPAALSALGVTGATLVTIQARVVEPPVYFCGPASASTVQFHTSAIRLKINITVPTPAVINGLLNLPPLVQSSNLAILPDFSVYVTVASAQGFISQLTPNSGSTGALRVKITPGVTSLYLGSIADSVFLDRNVMISAGSFGYADIANSSIKLLGAALISGQVQMKSSASGSAPVQEELIFNGPFPQTLSTSSSLNAVGNLATSLLTNLQLTGNLNLLGLLNLSVLTDGALQPIKDVISVPLSTVLSGVADPITSALGIKIGQAVVTAYGAYNFCNVSGNCYSDVNHSYVKDAGEAGTGQTLWAKLVATSSPTTVYASTTVDSTTGAFSFANVQAQGTSGTGYTLLIDTNQTTSDVTATRPTGWISTETPTFTRALTVVASDFTGQTFGLYNGSNLAGRVFVDTGVGSGGIANNVIKDGTEPGLPGARVSITDNAGTTIYDSTLAADTGNYLLWIPAAAGATTLKVTELNPNPYLSTGANVGTTGGAYTRATDTVAFTHTVGSTYTGVNFADVPSSTFVTDGRQVVLPGNVAFYPHAFTAGTAGSVSVTASAPSMTGWSNAIYNDTNCNGAIDTGEALLAVPLSVVAAQKVCLVVRVFASDVAAYNDEYPVSLSASFAWSGSALSEALARNDLTVIGSASGAGLALTKTVDKATAVSGNTLLYTITYTNHSSKPLSTIKIYDTTPAYTVYASGACGTLGAGLSGCVLTTQPGAGTAGNLLWTLSGSLNSGASGTVTFTVTVQ